jgi:hypothetical protein
MENLYNPTSKSENNQNPIKRLFFRLFGLKNKNNASELSKIDRNNVVEDREQLFKDLFGVPYTEDEGKLNKIIKDKIDNLNETERLSMNDTINSKVKEIESTLNIKKSKTLKRIFTTFALLTIAMLSSWYLFSNDVIINMKLILCQSAIIGFICGFKELHVLIEGKKESI